MRTGPTTVEKYDCGEATCESSSVLEAWNPVCTCPDGQTFQEEDKTCVTLPGTPFKIS